MRIFSFLISLLLVGGVQTAAVAAKPAKLKCRTLTTAPEVGLKSAKVCGGWEFTVVTKDGKKVSFLIRDIKGTPDAASACSSATCRDGVPEDWYGIGTPERFYFCSVLPGATSFECSVTRALEPFEGHGELTIIKG